MRKRKAVKSKKRRGRIVRLRASAELEDLPEIPGGWVRYYRPLKQSITLRLDADVIAWFKKQGRGYQTKMNGTLRAAMMAKKTGLGGHAP